MKMTKAICPGSFDPVTNGHIKIFERAAKIFDEIIVGVFSNIRKTPFLPIDERLSLLREATAHIKNLRVDAFDGLLADYARQSGAGVIVRGLRDQNDFFYETSQMMMLKHMAPELESVYLVSEKEYAYLSSSAIREMASFGASIEGLVPPCVEVAIEKKLQKDN